MQVSELAKQLTVFAEAAQSGVPVDELAVWQSFEQMLTTEAETAQDALALLANARRILNMTMMPTDSLEGCAQHCALLLMRNAISALEKLSGEREATYTGHDWH